MKYLAQARSYLSTIILGQGEEYQVVDRTFSGWSDLSQAAQTQISAETGYPAVILWGTAPGGMSSDDQSARRTMSAVVESEAEQRLAPAYRQIAEAMLPAGESVTVEIPSVDVPSPMEIADVELKNAQTYALYTDRGVLAAEQVAEAVFGPTKEITWMPDELPDTETIDDTAPDLTGG